MNQRIRELAELAKGFVDLNQHIGGTNGCMVYTYNGLEKFAELIVRECANSANDWYQNHDKIHSDPMSYVLAHFGVEE